MLLTHPQGSVMRRYTRQIDRERDRQTTDAHAHDAQTISNMPHTHAFSLSLSLALCLSLSLARQVGEIDKFAADADGYPHSSVALPAVASAGGREGRVVVRGVAMSRHFIAALSPRSG